MDSEAEELRARIAHLERVHVSIHAMISQLQSREQVLRAAVMALIYHTPKGALIEDFSMFLDQVVAALPQPFQKPEFWQDMIYAIEDDRKQHFTDSSSP